MERRVYLKELERELKKLPKQELQEVIQYYKEYFDDAGPENEQSVIGELGQPKDAADQILKEKAIKRLEAPREAAKKGMSTIWIVILAVCAVPVGLPVALAVVIILLALVICLLSVCLAIGISGVAFILSGIIGIVCGITFLPGFPPDGIAVLGVGFTSVGIGLLCLLLTGCAFRGGTLVLAKVMSNFLMRGKKDEKEMD